MVKRMDKIADNTRTVSKHNSEMVMVMKYELMAASEFSKGPRHHTKAFNIMDKALQVSYFLFYVVHKSRNTVFEKAVGWPYVVKTPAVLDIFETILAFLMTTKLLSLLIIFRNSGSEPYLIGKIITNWPRAIFF